MDKDIKELIEKIKNATSKEDAIFIIQEYGGGSDESFVKANKEGLLLFASEILEAYLEKDEQEKSGKDTFGIEGPNDLYEQGDTKIDYIQYTNEKRKSFDKDAQSGSTLKQKLFKTILILILILVVWIFIAGFTRIVSWIFG